LKQWLQELSLVAFQHFVISDNAEKIIRRSENKSHYEIKGAGIPPIPHRSREDIKVFSNLHHHIVPQFQLSFLECLESRQQLITVGAKPFAGIASKISTPKFFCCLQGSQPFLIVVPKLLFDLDPDPDPDFLLEQCFLKTRGTSQNLF
jgi:hypothetical protein